MKVLSSRGYGIDGEDILLASEARRSGKSYCLQLAAVLSGGVTDNSIACCRVTGQSDQGCQSHSKFYHVSDMSCLSTEFNQANERGVSSNFHRAAGASSVS